MVKKASTKEILEPVEGSLPANNQDDPDQDFEIESDEDFIQDEEPTNQDVSSVKKLPWLVNDFKDTTESVYEAASIASVRARQVGRVQKQAIDNWFAAHDITEGSEEIEDESEPGVDHFHHCKPTVQALSELKNGEIKYRYLEKKKK
jgi:DNA-directed RNA polymerase subunit K/omega